MDDQRLGAAIRVARVRHRWRQSDLAAAARVSSSTIVRVEAGHLETHTLATVRRICAALEIRLDLVPRSRGGDLDRMLSARHSLLHEAVARAISRDFPDWQMAPEVSFSRWGERGVIDLLLWHPARRALLVIELKTDLVDIGEMLGTLDRKRRLAMDVAQERGWDPVSVSAWIILADSRTNERRIVKFRTMLRSAYPASGRKMQAWLRNPVGPIAGLSLWADSRGQAHRLSPVRRVRPAAAARPR
jgi:transcriptional regulator with XRE-family HTH domain